MGGWRSAPPASAALSEWLWLGGGVRDARPEAAVLRKSRIAAALHVGHGLGSAFELRAESGPTVRLTLGCSSPAAARWIARALVPAYGRSTWLRVPPLARSPGVDLEWARRVRPWPHPFREGSDGPTAAAVLGLALSGVAPGTRIHWRFSPVPASWRTHPRLDTGDVLRPASVATDPRVRHPGSLSSAARLPRPATPVFWIARLSLEFPVEAAGVDEDHRRIRTAVEGALRSGGGNGVRFRRPGVLSSRAGPGFELAEDELAATLPDPDGVGAVPFPEPASAPILPLGRSESGQVVGPRVEAAQGRHLAVLGETGMGKSATLVALALKAKNLGGVVLFDPLGETATSFVRELSPKERRDRLVWVSPRDGSSRINALEGIGRPQLDSVHADRRLTDLVHALRRVRSGRYDSSYWGPRLEEMLTRALAAAAAIPFSTLADAHTLLATGGRTRQVVPPESQDAVRELADRIRERPEDAEGARRLLYEVVRSSVLSRMLCDREPSRHASELVTPGRIAVISGEAAAVGESTARYLSAVYLALVWSELLARTSRGKTFVVLDESQWFAHESLAEMLRLARRRNVHVILATQTVGSLPEGVRDAVWANVSDFVAFRGSPEEARELARATSGVSVEEILSLPRGHAVVLLGKGNSVAWIRTVGRPAGSEESPDRDQVPEQAGTGLAGTDRPDRSVLPVTVEEVLEWLRGRARSDGSGSRLRVSLARLRAAVDPEGKAVREAGALLRRTGALLSSTREEAGAVWTLDPSRIPPSPAKTVSPLSNRDAEAPQPS